jgi:prephenate dehydrogenase
VGQWQKVTVIGCGLIGSSFALAMKEARGASERIAGWDASPAVLDEALRRGIIDEVDGSFPGGSERLAIVSRELRAHDLSVGDELRETRAMFKEF